jgi:6-phosphofructokinase 1
MVAMRNNETVLVPLEDAAKDIRCVPQDSPVVQTGRDLGICFGDEPNGTFEAETINPMP